jgi:uncharacterized protein YaeQ
MAVTSTLYDFQLALCDVDRGVEQQLSFKLPRHPSELMERVWLKVLAFAWLWEERLVFGPGLAEPDAPDLVTRDYTNLVTRWVRVGKGEPTKVQRAIDQHPDAKVCVLFEREERLRAFFAEGAEAKLNRLAKGEYAAVDAALLKALAPRDERRARLSITLSGDHFYVDLGGETFDGPLVRGSFPPA